MASTFVWPEWRVVVEHWQSCSAVEVEVRPWLETSMGWDGWTPKDKYGQRLPADPVAPGIRASARHIAFDFPRMSEEEKIAYKLEAFCRQAGLDGFMRHVVFDAYRHFDERSAGPWWPHNTRTVTPVSSHYPLPIGG